jgi:hypothetical protein
MDKVQKPSNPGMRCNSETVSFHILDILLFLSFYFDSLNGATVTCSTAQILGAGRNQKYTQKDEEIRSTDNL